MCVVAAVSVSAVSCFVESACYLVLGGVFFLGFGFVNFCVRYEVFYFSFCILHCCGFAFDDEGAIFACGFSVDFNRVFCFQVDDSCAIAPYNYGCHGLVCFDGVDVCFFLFLCLW